MVELKLKKPTINQNIFFYFILLLLFIIIIIIIFKIIFFTKQMHLPIRNWVLTI